MKSRRASKIEHHFYSKNHRGLPADNPIKNRCHHGQVTIEMVAATIGSEQLVRLQTASGQHDRMIAIALSGG